MTEPVSAPTPVAAGERITSLDTIRGAAVLGILVMNVVSYALPLGSYFRIDGPGTVTPVDWVVAVVGEIVVDQKFMGLFSLLFGAGIAHFADRAAAKGQDPITLSLWRNGLLLLIGALHRTLWAGDVLIVYALCAPVVVLARVVPVRRLIVLGSLLVVAPVPLAGLVQAWIGDDGAQLGDLWLQPGPMAATVATFVFVDYFARALGMMLIGVALHRTGFLAGTAPASQYRRVTVLGLGLGWGLAAVGVAVVAAADWSPSLALIGLAPNTLGTIPAAVGYTAALVLWDGGSARSDARGARRWLHRRLQAVGRMALTNYLSQTVIVVLLFVPLVQAADIEVTRTLLAGLVVVVWALQLSWSTPWLARFRHGPVEWLWRCGTYQTWLPLARDESDR